MTLNEGLRDLQFSFFICIFAAVTVRFCELLLVYLIPELTKYQYFMFN